MLNQHTVHSVIASQEDYDSLTSKTLSFLRTAVDAWDAEYIVKVLPTLSHTVESALSRHRSSLAMAYTRKIVGVPGCRWMMMYTCTCNICELPQSSGRPCRLVMPMSLPFILDPAYTGRRWTGRACCYADCSGMVVQITLAA